MRYTLTFEERPGFAAASLACELTPASIEEAMTRLRSWALIRGAEIAGRPFVAIHGRVGGRVCLPLATGVYPHPETGIVLEKFEEGHIAHAAPASLDGLFEQIDLLQGRLSPDRPLRGCAEYYPGDRVGEGELTLPLMATPIAPPVELNIPEPASV